MKSWEGRGCSWRLLQKRGRNRFRLRGLHPQENQSLWEAGAGQRAKQRVEIEKRRGAKGMR